MGEEVACRTEDGEWFLDAEHPSEGPFAVELDYGLRGDGGYARGSDDVLADMVAFGGTGPEEEAVEEGNRSTMLRIRTTILALADLDAFPKVR